MRHASELAWGGFLAVLCTAGILGGWAASSASAGCGRWCRVCTPAYSCGKYHCSDGCASTVYMTAPSGYYESYAGGYTDRGRDVQTPYDPRNYSVWGPGGSAGRPLVRAESRQDGYVPRVRSQVSLDARLTPNVLRQARQEDEISIHVLVPHEARLWFNDRRTTSRGEVREFTARRADPNERYKFSVRAELAEGREKVRKEKVLVLAGGDATTLKFDFRNDPKHEIVQLRSPGSPQAWLTLLTLHVPSDARLYLADTLTSQTGPVRVFETSEIPAGGQWRDYAMRVELERDGMLLTREATITLKAGESHEFTLDPTFASDPPLPVLDDQD